MKDFDLQFWWRNNRENKTETVETVLDGLWLLYTHTIEEVADDSIDFNVGGLQYYMEEFKSPEYGLDDGLCDLYFQGEYEEPDDILEGFGNYLEEEEGVNWKEGNIENLKAFLKIEHEKYGLEAEEPEIKLY